MNEEARSDGVSKAEMRTFYRIVKHEHPDRTDFLSYRELGIPLLKRNPSPADWRSWESVSTFTSEEAARLRARLNRDRGSQLGEYIAKLELPDDASVTIGRVSASGHCDLTGDPDVLLANVTLVVPVEPQPGVTQEPG